jgi:hypothetical protein
MQLFCFPGTKSRCIAGQILYPESHSSQHRSYRLASAKFPHAGSRTMPTALKLDHRKPITYESAIKKDVNIINQAAYFEAAEQLYQVLWDQRQTIQVLVKHHLRLGTQDTCIVTAQEQWIRGSFNICIPVEVRSTRFHKKLMFRCPMPQKLAEAKYPGTVDEKLSSEVGTYVWMQDRCPDIRIPHLYGFGFSDHRHVSPLHRFMTFVLIMPLAYSLYMSNKGLFISAFGVWSNAVSTVFFNGLPSRTIPKATQPAKGFLPHICYLSISVLIRARCSLVRGRSTETTFSGGRISSEA